MNLSTELKNAYSQVVFRRYKFSSKVQYMFFYELGKKEYLMTKP